MSKRKKSVAAALLITAASATAAWVIKQRQGERQPHVGLYFEDGSMVSLPEHSPHATELIGLGADAVSLIRGG